MRFLIPILLASLTACGQFRANAYQDPALIPYVRDYQAACSKYRNDCDVSEIGIVFSDINSGDIVGECKTGFDDDGYITHNILVDTPAWKGMNESTRHVLIYHELGHCQLNRRHDDRMGPITPGGSDEPVSIMNAYVINGFLFQNFTAYYERELFLGPY